MNLKNACRLCCSREGVTYDLFSPCVDGVSLAEELYSLVNIKITKEDELPASICANCYRVNIFFKEFRENCSQVNDYLKKTVSAEKRVSIKTEKEDDYVDQSINPAPKPVNESDSATNASSSQNALVPSVSSGNLDQLRTNFLAAKRIREEASTAALPESSQLPEDAPPQRGSKRKLDNATDNVARKQISRTSATNEEDYLNHVVKQEEVDIYDSPVEDYNDADSLEDSGSPEPSQLTDDALSIKSPLLCSADSCSSDSSCSSGDSDEDAEMFMLLALLL